MKTFHSPLHRGHAGTHEIYRGELVPCFEKPERAEFVLDALRRHAIGEVAAPTAFGRAPKSWSRSRNEAGDWSANSNRTTRAQPLPSKAKNKNLPGTRPRSQQRCSNGTRTFNACARPWTSWKCSAER